MSAWLSDSYSWLRSSSKHPRAAAESLLRVFSGQTQQSQSAVCFERTERTINQNRDIQEEEEDGGGDWLRDDAAPGDADEDLLPAVAV